MTVEERDRQLKDLIERRGATLGMSLASGQILAHSALDWLVFEDGIMWWRWAGTETGEHGMQVVSWEAGDDGDFFFHGLNGDTAEISFAWDPDSEAVLKKWLAHPAHDMACDRPGAWRYAGL